MPRSALQLDAVILGGGVAGLWTLAHLHASGYSCLLLETQALGAGQTVASQGIIHGGIKYALTGEASAASRAIAEMPGVWRACLAGERAGHPDLGGATVLADHQHLWTTPGVLSRLAGLGASKVIRTPVQREVPERRPPALAGAPRGVDVYRVDEPVLEARSLVRTLAAPLAARISLAREIRINLDRPLARIAFTGSGGREIVVSARHVVGAAGAGNEALLALIPPEQRRVAPQRRPLHMVLVRNAPAVIYGHCLGASAVPRLTITTGRAASGEAIWWVGGGIAESGVSRGETEQVAFARSELGECLPWLDLSRASLATQRWDRAEAVPIENGRPGQRPNEPVVTRAGPLILAWPTKLAFAPLLAERVRALIQEAGGGGRPEGPGDPPAPGLLEPAAVAPHVWEREGLR